MAATNYNLQEALGGNQNMGPLPGEGLNNPTPNNWNYGDPAAAGVGPAPRNLIHPIPAPVPGPPPYSIGTAPQATSGSGGPVNLSAYANQYPPNVLAAAQAIFAAKPDQAAALQNQFGGNLQNWLGSFTQWWSNNGQSVAGQMGNFQPEAGLLNALGYQNSSNGAWIAGPGAIGGQPAAPADPNATVNQPAEQGLYNETIGGLNNEVLNDQNLAQTTQQLQAQNKANYAQLGGVLGQAVGGQFDGNAYFRANPDVAGAFQSSGGVVPGVNGGQPMTADQFAAWHFQTYGKAEGRQPTFAQSGVVQNENQAAKASAQSQIGALQQSVAAMQGNLKGALADQAAALQQSLQQIQANIDQYGSTASQALTQQINQQLGNLQNSISSQKAALTQQIATLSGAADTASQQQLAALQTELSQLNTAEAPVAQARTQAAQAQVTAVNIGEAQAKNQIAGQAALQGFVGGSSMEDNALAQAGIGAQQQGAALVGDAATQNAQDYQTIANMGATSQDTLANQLAQQQQGITGMGATGQYNLQSALATGTQGLQDTGAAGQAAITNQVAGQKLGAGNDFANNNYANTSAGIQAGNALANSLATGQYGIDTNLANQQQANTQNQYTQSLQAALALGGLPSQEANSIAATDNLQNAGLLNAQNALNWWAAPASPSTPNTPQLATSVQTASNAGNSQAALGAGLIGAATQIGNSQNWWQTPAKTTPSTGGIDGNANMDQNIAALGG